MDQDQENDIIFRILKGERDAYALLVDAYKAQIFNLAYRMTGNYEDAADLAQETFVRAYMNLGKFHAGRPFFSWLYTIALNIIRNHVKRKEISLAAAQVRAKEEPDGKGKNNPERDMLDREQANRLAACVGQLPPDQREAVVLRYYQGLSFEEIAAIAGISLSAVKMRVYRGLEELRRKMEAE